MTVGGGNLGSVEEALVLGLGLGLGLGLVLGLGQVGLVSHQLLLVTAAAADRKLRIFEACIALQRVDNVSTGWRYSCVECCVFARFETVGKALERWGHVLKGTFILSLGHSIGQV